MKVFKPIKAILIKIHEQGEKVAQVAAHLDWYRHNSDTRYMIRFIIMRAQHTKFVHGYWFFQCNLESFTGVRSINCQALVAQTKEMI